MRPGCTPFEHELSAYIDGELADAERAHVEAHLKSCDRCRTEVRELRKVGETLRRWDAEETRYAQSTGFRNRVMSRLGAIGRATGEAAEARLWTRAAWAAAAAAGIVGAFAWGASRRADRPADLDEMVAQVRRIEHEVALLRERVPPAGSARDTVGAPPARLGDLPPLVGPPASRTAPGPVEVGDPWEVRGDGVLRDAVSDYEAFMNERRLLSMEERFAKVEHRDGGGTTSAIPAPPPSDLSRFFMQVAVSDTSFPPFEQIQVWPIEIAAPARGDPSAAQHGVRPLLLDQAIPDRVVSVLEEDGNVVAANDDVKARPVLLLAGDVLHGARQDRVVGQDMLVRPGHRVSVPAWGVGAARTGTRYRTFTRSRLLAPFDVRAVLQASLIDPAVGQRDVDAAVLSSLRELGSPSGGNIENLFNNDSLQGEVMRFVDAFRKRLDRPNVVGFAVAAGPRVLGIELCGDPETFRVVRDRLLKSHVLCALSLPTEVSSDGVAARATVQSLLTTAAHSVFDEPPASSEGTFGVFSSVDGRVFGYGLLDGSRVVHATVFAGMPGTGDGRGAAGRGLFGKAPGSPDSGPGESPGGTERPTTPPGSGGGVDAR